MAKVTMPQLGESVAEGTIGRWLKKPGDRVEKYEPIVEVITDKVNAEVPSPFAGTLTAILVEEGSTVPNDTPIAEIETADAGEPTAAPANAGPDIGASGTRARAGRRHAGTRARTRPGRLVHRTHRGDASRGRRRGRPYDARRPAPPP